ncbi:MULTISPECIES: MBL fold metallo-hydrolase [unclassified Gemella]|uniref:MBL fold metallo-hydrolase n=1 Tax=unclassified Gemella TaxID=2624949 RepID=UPI001072FD4B|nr:MULTISPECIES: MBL fold metallo-hydrolase [unclassified Gemella]MBF0710353.1 MBL fold metallo-hydrolase [Gemella sp. GL1.1]MBF0747030.1 MBL fold metallo-hydrolase [Gemella sp. 19428wG2_WT2a]NYS27697.1 MBL fold metallo-hydrolase [Gemella sp. GL1]TFU58846.1 MBL fold metallo-hydrolase [Gemella sp. WT2a]
MKMSVLASGSTGNAIYIEDGDFSCLVDAGLTGKKIIENLNSIGRDISHVKHIFVSHEHVDHIKGVGVLARKYNIPIYANKETWDNMPIGQVSSDLKFHFDKDVAMDFANLTIRSFGVSHDAANPQFYTFEAAGKKLSILTDTGYISEKMIDYIKNSDVLIYESNHEETMVMASSYPWKTKQRILSDLGHLSNVDSANWLPKIIGDNTKKIYLAHLSMENNTKDLARLTSKSILENYGFDCDNKIDLLDTDPKQATDLIEI